LLFRYLAFVYILMIFTAKGCILIFFRTGSLDMKNLAPEQNTWSKKFGWAAVCGARMPAVHAGMINFWLSSGMRAQKVAGILPENAIVEILGKPHSQ
jgi:hypothetical protein